MRLTPLALIAMALTLPATAEPFNLEDNRTEKSGQYQLVQAYSCGKSCGKVSSCREAVYQWCVCGYSRADGDNDGVPCEAVCGQSTPSALERIRSYKKELGCR